MVVWVLSGRHGRFCDGFRICFYCFYHADFAYLKVMYLSFYWTVSAHLLTVLYQMTLQCVQEYGSLGVIWVLWTVL